MPTLKSPDLEMHYVIDDFTDPWTKPETILKSFLMIASASISIPAFPVKTY